MTKNCVKTPDIIKTNNSNVMINVVICIRKPSLSIFPLENHKMEAICDTPYVLAYLWREIVAYLRIENSKKLYGGPNIEHN